MNSTGKEEHDTDLNTGEEIRAAGLPSVRSLDGVDLTLRAGEVLGRRVKMAQASRRFKKILLGIFAADEGSITLFGKSVSFAARARPSPAASA